VIQFQPGTDLELGLCQGRVEHITSYKALRFRSLDELLAFIAQILRENRACEEQDHEELA
jgi:hypothetical protein